MMPAVDPFPDPLASLDELFDIVELPTSDVPVRFAIAIPSDALLAASGFPQAARPETGRLASGRGLTAESCRASCLGEAAELVSCCVWGNEHLVTATDAELGSAVIPPEALNGFTDDQIDDRETWNRENAAFDWRPPRRDRSMPLDWLKVEDAFGGEPAYVPADFAFIGRKQAGDETAVAIGDSNGCAAGPSVDAAKLAAALELIERDATGRWWYGRRQRPTIDTDTIEEMRPLARWLAERERRSWLFDITTDIGVPVVAAASAEPDGRDVALGFAARVDVHSAAVAAVTEMLQMEISLSTARALGAAAGNWARWRSEVNMNLPPLDGALVQRATAAAAVVAQSTASLPTLPATNNGSSLASVLDLLARNGIDLWFADMTRDQVGTPVFRAVSAALCHYKPRFARGRLRRACAPDELGSKRVRQVDLLV